ncbi:MAG: hypothetical protein V4613_07840 [Bacteroidota bacterium]
MKINTSIIGSLALAIALLGCNNGPATKTSPKDSAKTTTTIDPNALLFTSATINDALPAFEEKKDTCTFINEDEWRQIEFISKDYKTDIDKEIADIKNIYDNFSHDGETYSAYKKIAVRKLITQPLSIDFSKLKAYLTNKAISMEGLAIENNPGKVKGGFFFTVNGISYYVVVDNNTVKTFCIYSCDSDAELKAGSVQLAKLLEKEKLYLVDWRAMQVYDEVTIKTQLAQGNEE